MVKQGDIVLSEEQKAIVAGGEASFDEIATMDVNFDRIVVLPFQVTEDAVISVILSIKCKRCGKCCGETNTSGTWVNSEEIAELSGFLKMRPRSFIKQYTHLVDGNTHIDMPCPFFTELGDKKICKVYHIRPLACQAYPVVVIPNPNDDGNPCIGVRCCPAGLEWNKDFVGYFVGYKK